MTDSDTNRALSIVERIQAIQNELVDLETELKELGVNIEADELKSPFVTSPIWDLDVEIAKRIRQAA